MLNLKHLFERWTWTMAWRDTRSSRRRLFLFSISIVLGIAALTAIASFRQNLDQAVEEQAKTLLGADLLMSSRSPFTPEEEAFFRSLGGEQSSQISFSSMIYFPGSEGTRLVQVRGLSGGFPYYGRLGTEPVSAATEFRTGGGALVEESLLIQYNARVGDEVRLGKLTTRIAGSLRKVPGETVLFATISPRVYLSQADLERTQLLRAGSLAAYRVYFRLPPGTDIAALVKRIQPKADEYRLRIMTVEERKGDLGNSMANLGSYLNMAALVALLLGGLGVGSAVHVHIKQKANTVAVLRCLGAVESQTFAIYLAQAAGLGLCGATLGTALGVAIQRLIPLAVTDFLPFPLPVAFSWSAVAQGFIAGFLICLLFALLPLLAVRRFTPLAAIRAAYEAPKSRRGDPVYWLVLGIVVAGLAGFSMLHAHRWKQGLAFVGGIGVAFVLLWLVASALTAIAKRFVPARLPYVWRQGLANLHRPQNRTVLMLLAIGLGTFMLLTLYLTKETLLTRLVSSAQTNQANTVLFDIQSDQTEDVADLLRGLHLAVLDEAPIVTMRLQSVKDRTVEQLLADKKSGIPGWTLRREYRSTYNTNLRSGEQIISGVWHPTAAPGTNPIPVSVEEGIAKELGVGLGDELVFDVQGVPITTRVASLRRVDWRLVQPNFYVVFPAGTLEDAPAIYVLVTRVKSAQESAALQRAVVRQFPNVSAIDLTLILQTLDSIIEKVSFAIRFMAGFTVLTGLLVMAGAILTSRYQRIQESVLLRTLGASRRQVTHILLAEYLALGAMAALTGLVLAATASWALAQFVFEVPFSLPLLPLLAAFGGVTCLTVIVGMLSSRGILTQPPLASLRGFVVSS